MAEFKLTNQETQTVSSKGSTSQQTYSGNTVRTVNTTPAGYTETGTTNKVGQPVTRDTNRTTNRTGGTTVETRTSDGVNTTRTKQEDLGVVLKFTIPIQQKNPVPRITP